jgi:uncharacterized protein (DUF169 family)
LLIIQGVVEDTIPSRRKNQRVHVNDRSRRACGEGMPGEKANSNRQELIDMDVILRFEDRYGGRWCGVEFGRNENGKGIESARPIPFCEAVGQPGMWPIVLEGVQMDCPGGSRSFGWYDNDEALAVTMAAKSGVSVGVANRIIAHTPKLEGSIERVTVGTRDCPDVLISYAQPETAMQLLREWQALCGTQNAIETSGFMSVCGTVAVKAYLSGTVCASLGCPVARERAKIERDRLIIGLSTKTAARIVGIDDAALIASGYGVP